MKLSEFLNRITPEEEGGHPGTESIVLSGGVEVLARQDDWDTYKVTGECGEWMDGLHVIRHLIGVGALPDPEVEAEVKHG